MVLRTENFNVDPGWDGHNNRSNFFGPAGVNQNFGYGSNRIGGTINPTGSDTTVVPSREAFYFAQTVSNSNFNTMLTATGTLNNNGGGNSWIGFFNSATANEWRSANSLGLRIYGRGNHFLAYPEYGTSKWRAGADGFVSGGNEVQFPVNANLLWSLTYDPAGNAGGGSITAVINGQTVTKNLDAGHKLDGATFNRFGMGAVNKSWDSPGQLFLDSLNVNNTGTQSFTGSAPGWSGVNNIASYNTNNVRFRFDFGYDATRQAAGGNFFRGDSRQANTMAFYGDELDQTLTLNQPLHAQGKVTFSRGVTDSTVHLGFFHNTDSVRVSNAQAMSTPENFVGVTIEGPSAEGFFFYPSYNTDAEGQGSGGNRGSGAPYIYPDGATHNWTLDYNPDGNNGNGQIIVSLDGQQGTMNLAPGDKQNIGAHFNRFGFITPHIDGNGQTVFVDDVTYTVGFGAGKQWGINDSGDWGTASNWIGGVPNGVGAQAFFGSNNTQGHAVFANSNVTVGTLDFNSPNSWLITGLGTLTLQVASGAAQVNVAQGSHKINLPVIVASNTQVNVAAGAQLRVSDRVTVAANKSLTHTGSGTVTYESTVTLQSGATMAFGGLAEVGGLLMAGDAGIDVRKSLLVNGGDYDSVLERVRQGRNGGDWLGDGITSSSAAKDASGGTALGIVDDGDATLVKYTFYGDADLSGVVTASDFDSFVGGFAGGGSSDWIDGDFDLSGHVDLADFDRLYLGLKSQAHAEAALVSSLQSFSDAHGLGIDVSAVPEPSGIVLASLAAAGLLRRRRHGAFN